MIKDLLMFTCPKPYTESTSIIQNNALNSWKYNISPKHISLFGDGNSSCKSVEKNKYGTPLIKSLFKHALIEAKNLNCKYICYVNADVILLPCFVTAMKKLKKALIKQNISRFVMSSQRYEVYIDSLIKWDNVSMRFDDGVYDYKAAIELFLFNAFLFDKIDIPDELAVGRPGWDHWMLWQAKKQGAIIIDGTNDFKIIHQMHDYQHRKGGFLNVWGGEEASASINKVKGVYIGLDKASHNLTNGDLIQGPLKEKTSNEKIINYRISLAEKEMAKNNYIGALDFIRNAIYRGGDRSSFMYLKNICLQKTADCLPLVFFHYGNHKYVEKVLKQAKVFNENVYILGNKHNSHWQQFVKHECFEEYESKDTEELKSLYIHRNINAEQFSLFNILRWFYLRDFMINHKVSSCVHIDSDVYIYSNLQEEKKKFTDNDITMSGTLSGHFAYVNNIKALEDFCEWTLNIYRENKIESMPGEVCDMGLLRMFFHDNIGNKNYSLGDTNIIINGSVFEHAHDWSGEGHEMTEEGVKKLYWLKGHPYGKTLEGDFFKFNSLHCHGAKNRMEEFFEMFNEKKSTEDFKKTFIGSLKNSIQNISIKKEVNGIISLLEKDPWHEKDLELFGLVFNNKISGEWFNTPVFLNWYSKNFKPSTYLEIGVRRGRSLIQVLKESPKTNIYGFDLWVKDYGTLPSQNIVCVNPGPDFLLKECFKFNTSQPTFISGNSLSTIPSFFQMKDNPQQIELITVDGNHSYEGAQHDLDICFNHLSPGGALVFDDIYHHAHKDLKDLWETYKIRYPENLWFECSFGTGTGISIKPPFTKYLNKLGDLQC